MYRRPGRNSKIAPRSRDESEEDIRERPQRIVEIPTSNRRSVAKSFHTTISEDRTDQEALEAHRLVALQQKSDLQQKSELNDPFDSDLLTGKVGDYIKSSSSREAREPSYRETV